MDSEKLLARPDPNLNCCWFLHTSEVGKYEKVMSISLSPITIASVSYNAWLEWIGPNVPTVYHKTKFAWSYYYNSSYQIGPFSGGMPNPITGSYTSPVTTKRSA